MAYTFWCGSDIDWNKPYGQMDNNGAFWIRPRLISEPGPNNFRAGFNLDLFLGNNALAIPVMTDPGTNPGATYSKVGNTVRANSLVEYAVSRGTIRVRGLRNGGVATTLVTVTGQLVASNFDTSNNGDDKLFELKAYLREYTGGVPGGVYLIQKVIMDDYSPETFLFCLSAPINAIPGDYKVELYLDWYEDRRMSIIQGWNVVAMQVATNGALT